MSAADPIDWWYEHSPSLRANLNHDNGDTNMNTIDIRITLPTDMKSTAVSKSEELLIHQLVADNAFVESAVILRNDGFANLLPDESTRQER
jgi:hypothetical protein